MHACSKMVFWVRMYGCKDTFVVNLWWLNQVLLGDMGTGKTSLVLRFVKGQFFDFQVRFFFVCILSIVVDIVFEVSLIEVVEFRNQPCSFFHADIIFK